MNAKVMLRIILSITFAFYKCKSNAQNLIPNPGFEVMTACPATASQISFATPWVNPASPPQNPTPDYFNVCALLSSGVGIPFSGFGYQYAHAGEAYAGFYTLNFAAPNVREYIQVALTDTLNVGKEYCVSFYVSLADYMGYSTNTIGAYFSQTAVSQNNDFVLPYTPQVVNSSFNPLTDTMNWILISGNFTATGNEEYVTIGNFSTDANSDTVRVNSLGTNSYYFIDDVSVFEIKNVDADAGKDTIICNGNAVQLGSTNYQGITYNWQPSIGLNNANIGIPIASPTQTTTYYLTQTTPCNISTDTVTVTVCEHKIQVPNIFTPNNDGINDFLKITTKNITTLNCKIYNRWGVLVSELTKVNEGWDGRSESGLQCVNGVYYYVLTATGDDGKEYDEKGFLQLIR